MSLSPLKNRANTKRNVFQFGPSKSDTAPALICENRRVTGLIPQWNESTFHTDWTGERITRKLLVVENSEESCCVKISSERHLSRSALLIARGRLVGCLYGNKHLSQLVFGEEARQRAFNDLSDLKSSVHCYKMTDEFALSAAALFHGERFSSENFGSPYLTLNQGHHFMMTYRTPGFVTISDEDTNSILLSTYFFDGRILGAFSNSEGWMKTDFKTSERFLSLTAHPLVSVFQLNLKAEKLLSSLSSSPSGLGDRTSGDWKYTQEGFRSDFGLRLLQFVNKTAVPPGAPQLNKFLPGSRIQSSLISNSMRNGGAFPGQSFSFDPVTLG